MRIEKTPPTAEDRGSLPADDLPDQATASARPPGISLTATTIGSKSSHDFI